MTAAAAAAVDPGAPPRQAGEALDARVKLIAALALLVAAASTPPAAWPAFAAYGGLVALAALAGRVRPGYLARRLLLVVPFVLPLGVLLLLAPTAEDPLGVATPGVASSPRLALWNVAAKATLGVATVAALTATTPIARLLTGLEGLGAPRLVVALTALTHRYLQVLGDEARRMGRARDARGYRARWLWQAAPTGHLLGALFLRAHARAERSYRAMLARGYAGHFPAPDRPRLRGADLSLLALVLTVLAAIRIGLA